ncbi:hypothetical protein B0T22DRAFT_42528 [Podospora appendiculata]|uniref:Uncharacterized protein n=1 Tax=Podospora appendiculata TaxID=314037 RepID=A0AAE1CGJ0_9PEZI|nr:hypothetical protein B0T22DRAFT_42528 [Podospora appendiculata]
MAHAGGIVNLSIWPYGLDEVLAIVLATSRFQIGCNVATAKMDRTARAVLLHLFVCFALSFSRHGFVDQPAISRLEYSVKSDK